MLAKLRNSGLMLPLAMTLVGLFVLIRLGNWQMERLAWKESLIERIDARVKAPPMSLAKAEAIWKDSQDVEYLHVAARGRFLHDEERHYYAPEAGRSGWHIYTPLKTQDGRLLLVNRGFVPDAAKEPKSRAAGQTAGIVRVVGLLRKPGKKGYFTPANNARKNIWYWRDLNGMLASLGEKREGAYYPFFLEADAQAKPLAKTTAKTANADNADNAAASTGASAANAASGSASASAAQQNIPRGGATLLKITNKHYEYALTWYGLAATLIGVFLSYAWSRLRSAKPSD